MVCGKSHWYLLWTTCHLGQIGRGGTQIFMWLKSLIPSDVWSRDWVVLCGCGRHLDTLLLHFLGLEHFSTHFPHTVTCYFFLLLELYWLPNLTAAHEDSPLLPATILCEISMFLKGQPDFRTVLTTLVPGYSGGFWINHLWTQTEWLSRTFLVTAWHANPRTPVYRPLSWAAWR